MEHNIPEEYKNTTPAKALDNKMLNKMVWRSLFLQASFNYERMQAAGWLYAILPGLKKIHKDNKEDLAASMSHNLEFFSTHPFFVTFVMGIVLSLEQNKADIPIIRAVRVSLMGSLGGIGEAIFWFTLVPITAGIASNMAIEGNIAEPFLFLILFNIVQFTIRFSLMHWSYKLGTDAIKVMTSHVKELTHSARIFGIFIVGALTCVYGATTLDIQVPSGGNYVLQPVTTVISSEELVEYEGLLFASDEKGNRTEKLQDGASVTLLDNGKYEITFIKREWKNISIDIQEILDGILPSMIPLAFTLALFYLLSKRNFTPLKCIGVLLLIGIIGSVFGIWPAA